MRVQFGAGVYHAGGPGLHPWHHKEKQSYHFCNAHKNSLDTGNGIGPLRRPGSAAASESDSPRSKSQLCLSGNYSEQRFSPPFRGPGSLSLKQRIATFRAAERPRGRAILEVTYHGKAATSLPVYQHCCYRLCDHSQAGR